jgi:Zn-dependent peptidase ImmA (M78 family)
VSAQKVIIVSSTSFDSNMINYAKKKNGDISLLYFPNTFRNANWTLERKSTFFIKVKEDKPKFIIDLFPKNENNLLSNYKLITKNNLNQVAFMNDSTIDKRVLNILSKIDYENGIVDLNKIILLLENENKIYTKYNQSLEEGVLGEINFEKSIILIDNHQCETLARIRFTLAHEIAHFLLGHSQYMLGEKHTMQDAKIIENQLPISAEDIMKMEFQANYFASVLLLLEGSFFKDIRSLLMDYDVKDRGLGIFFVDNQRCNIDTYMKITSRLMHRYKVSRQVIEIRLKKLGLLEKVDTYEFVKNVHQGIINKKINWNYND